MMANDQRVWQVSIWSDANYDGDLTRFSDALYTYGRESSNHNFLPNFPVKAIFDNGPAFLFVSSEKFGPAEWYVVASIASDTYPSEPPIELLIRMNKYKSYPSGDKFDMCGTGRSAFNADAVNLNKRYVNGTVEDRRHIKQTRLNSVHGMLWYILNSSSIPNRVREHQFNVVDYVMINR
ncbi:unnamed protein product [Adineta ricciae]|uniref:Uncharacterized protein n=1 Tax=Adineta ricciae TaxID=249248 RepID=A0A815HC73_ADIRI|nr:unnamed protein product [Adineta ricciae]CAF1348958.1 unnamed protein product [Adineta ricciae]